VKTELIILLLGGLVFLSHFFVDLFERTNIPDVFWLMVIGFVIGPILGIASPQDFGQVGLVLSKITLVIILFEGGLELEFNLLKKFASSAVALTILGYILSLVAIWGLLSVFTSFHGVKGLYCAAVLAGPAPSVIIPILTEGAGPAKTAAQ